MSLRFAFLEQAESGLEADWADFAVILKLKMVAGALVPGMGHLVLF